jgi:hypothetical protein
MFFRGSRYRNLPESSPLDAQGQRLRGKDLRIIPRSTGRFLQTVQDRDRLDLLAFKFYGDASKWWQISDANPQFPFPNDLLDRRPLIDEVLSLVSPGAVAAFGALVTALEAIGTVHMPAEDHFVASTIVVAFAGPEQRVQILAEIAARDFHFIRSFAWTEDALVAEAFTVDNQLAKLHWRELFEDLSLLPGMVEIVPDLTNVALRLSYNSALTPQAEIRAAVKQRGFTIDSQTSYVIERAGDRIVVPPNEIA